MEVIEEHVGRDVAVIILQMTVGLMQRDVLAAREETRMLSRDIASKEDYLLGNVVQMSQRSARFLDTLNLNRTQAISNLRSEADVLFREIVDYKEPRNSLSLSSMQMNNILSDLAPKYQRALEANAALQKTIIEEHESVVRIVGSYLRQRHYGDWI